MRVLNWNIQQGGGSRLPQICRHIADIGPDLLVLSEFRSAAEVPMKAALDDLGLTYIATSAPGPGRNGLLVASKWPLLASGPSAPDTDPERWLALYIAEADLDVLAVHIPGTPDNKFEAGYGISGAKRKELMWERILAYAAEHHDRRAIVAGDFNTGLRIDAQGEMFKQSQYIQRFIEAGFVDAWREQHPQVRDYTWYTKRKDKETGVSADLNGFRLDYVFVSPRLRHVIGDAAILQVPRKAGASDHASVVLDVDVDPAPTQQITPRHPVTTAPERLPVQPNHGSSQRTSSASPDVSLSEHSLREEILELLRRADCHYGNTLRDEEAGWTVEHAARERNVKSDRIVELRAAVRRAGNGEHSRTKTQAGHEDGVLRALLHFHMSAELRQHIDARLVVLKADFIPTLKAVPLQCNTRGANRPRRTDNG